MPTSHPRRRYALAVVVPSDAERLIGSIELRVVSCETAEARLVMSLRASPWGLGYATEATRRLLAFGSTNWACTRSPLPVAPRIALQSRSCRRTACTRREFFATTSMPGASGENDYCSASSADWWGRHSGHLG